MRLLKRAAATAAALLALAAMAGATPVSGIVEEGGPEGYYFTGTADHRFRDFSSATGAPLMELQGDTTFYGSVTHISPTQYADGFTIDFGSDYYSLNLDIQNVLGTPFDALLRFASDGGSAGFPFSGFANYPSAGGNGTASDNFFGNTFTGRWTFLLDPRWGQTEPVETIRWQLSATQVAPVPLPASALLLLGAFGGLVAMRRRKTA